MFGIDRFDGLPSSCGRGHWPGIDEIPRWQDFSERDTTKGQVAVEDVIWNLKLAQHGRILHVGIGNSGLAMRFRDHFCYIAGITIQSGELRKAKSLAIPNYETHLFNKFQTGLESLFPAHFDVVVDNNPTSFCCCTDHFSTMMNNYLSVLKPGGVLLTDCFGLACWTSQADPRWGVTIEEWGILGSAFGFIPINLSAEVFGLQVPQDAEQDPRRR